MKYDRVFILTFEVGNKPDREVLQSAAALYFKHFHKQVNVVWYDCKRPDSGEYSFVPVCSSSGSGSESKTSTCGIYAIGHGGPNSFWGFRLAKGEKDEAKAGAGLILDFMEEAHILQLNQLNLVACGVLNPNKGGSEYLRKFADAFHELAAPKVPLKLVAWQSWMTIFDMRYLANMLCDSENHRPVVDELRKEIIQLLRKGALGGAKEVIEYLDNEYQSLMKNPADGKSFYKDTGTNFSTHLKDISGKNKDVVPELVGKKVGRMGLNANGKEFFTRSSPHIPEKLLPLIDKAIQFKKAQTFDWVYNAEEKKELLVNNSNLETTT